MVEPLEPTKPEKQSTYVVQDRNSEKELQRLVVQDRMITAGMGGVLPEFPDPTIFHRVLDVGCGTGGWSIEAARQYPEMSLVGIDISRRMVEYACTQAQEAQVADRVEFRVMDALQAIEFPDNSFDLVNLRLALSYVRKFEWRKIIEEMVQVVCPGGIVRIVETNYSIQSSSVALTRLQEMIVCAFYQSMHLFEPEPDGLIRHLPDLLAMHGYGCEQIQTKVYTFNVHAGTPEGQAYYEDMRLAMQTVRPFLQKCGCLSPDYDAVYKQACEEMQQPDFYASWDMVTVWGKKPE